MPKFEKLRVWRDGLDYLEEVYRFTNALPKTERYNLTSQWQRAATSILLNIAEGSTGQTDKEQSRFIGMAARFVIETLACLRIAERRGYGSEEARNDLNRSAISLLRSLQAFRNALDPKKRWRR